MSLDMSLQQHIDTEEWKPNEIFDFQLWNQCALHHVNPIWTWAIFFGVLIHKITGSVFLVIHQKNA